MRLRLRLRSPSERDARSRPWTTTFPLVGASSPIIRLAVVVFPHPDSPTMARTSPGRSSRETPSTALISDRDSPARVSRSVRGRGNETETWLRLRTVSDTRHRALLEQEAGGFPLRAQHIARRLLDVATVEGGRAPRGETTSDGYLIDPGRVSGDRHQFPLGIVEVGEGLEEQLGVGMLWIRSRRRRRNPARQRCPHT